MIVRNCLVSAFKVEEDLQKTWREEREKECQAGVERNPDLSDAEESGKTDSAQSIFTVFAETRFGWIDGKEDRRYARGDSASPSSAG
ncbi:MAG: hypothetical protein WAN11_19005 [Syntrophobacteraceae bacterium]